MLLPRTDIALLPADTRVSAWFAPRGESVIWQLLRGKLFTADRLMTLMVHSPIGVAASLSFGIGALLGLFSETRYFLFFGMPYLFLFMVTCATWSLLSFREKLIQFRLRDDLLLSGITSEEYVVAFHRFFWFASCRTLVLCLCLGGGLALTSVLTGQTAAFAPYLGIAGPVNILLSILWHFSVYWVFIWMMVNGWGCLVFPIALVSYFLGSAVGVWAGNSVATILFSAAHFYFGWFMLRRTRRSYTRIGLRDPQDWPN